MTEKVAQTHVHREDGIYFVSTINRRSSSMFAHDMIYAETMAWGPARKPGPEKWQDGRGPLVLQTSGISGGIGGHLDTCRLIHKFGNKAEVEASHD